MRPSWWTRIHDDARLDGAHNGTQIMAYGKGEKLTSMDRTLADIKPVRAQDLRERHERTNAREHRWPRSAQS